MKIRILSPKTCKNPLIDYCIPFLFVSILPKMEKNTTITLIELMNCLKWGISIFSRLILLKNAELLYYLMSGGRYMMKLLI